MHTPAYRRLYVHVLCTYELCSSAKLPSSLAEHWQCALAVPPPSPFSTDVYVCVCCGGIVSLREGRRLLVPSRV